MASDQAQHLNRSRIAARARLPQMGQVLAARTPGHNPCMSSSPKVLFGFHAVGVRIKTAPESVI
jgi:hypothetical protein